MYLIPVSISTSVFYELKFWYPGAAGPQLILMIIFIVNNGGPTEHPFSVTSGEIISIITELSLVNNSLLIVAVFSAGSLLYGIYASGTAWYQQFCVWDNDDDDTD